jgi:hypothetical protein
VRVDLFVDPACMWSWLTSRWLVEVAPERGLEGRWRPYSLLLRNGPEGLEDWKAAVWGASLRAVRVLQALDAKDPDRVRGFYETVVSQGVAALPGPGRRPGRRRLTARVRGAADDVSRDEHIRRSMAEAFAVIGPGVGTPALIIHRDPPVGLLGRWSLRPRPAPMHYACGTPWSPSPPCPGAGAVTTPDTAPHSPGPAVADPTTPQSPSEQAPDPERRTELSTPVSPTQAVGTASARRAGPRTAAIGQPRP